MSGPNKRTIAFTNIGCGLLLLLLLQFTGKPIDLFGSFASQHAIAVFCAALLESVYLLGLYFPGSLIISAAMLGVGCTFETSALIVALIWTGAGCGLLIDLIVARAFFVAGSLSNLPEVDGRFWGPLVSGFHPNVAAMYVFNKAARDELTLKSFAALLGSGGVFLSFYMALLCSFGEFVRSEQTEISSGWSLLLIGIGILQLVRLKRSKNS